MRFWRLRMDRRGSASILSDYVALLSDLSAFSDLLFFSGLSFFRSVQRMLEGAIGMPNGQYRAMSFAHDPLRHAPHQYVRQAAPSMGSEHNQVSALAMRGIDDLEKGRSYFQQAA